MPDINGLLQGFQVIPGWGDTKRLHGNKAAEDSDAAPRGRTRFLALRAKRPLHQPCVPAHAALRRSAPPPPRPPSLTGGGQGRPHTPAARPPGHRERRLELELTQPRESAQRLQRSGAPRGSEARGRGFRARSGGRSPARPGRVGRRQGHRHSRSAGRGPPAPGASRAGAPRRHPCAVLAALWTACSRGRPGGLLRCTWRSGRVQAPPPGPSWWQDPHCGTRKESVCEPSPTPPRAQRLARPRPRPVRTLARCQQRRGSGAPPAHSSRGLGDWAPRGPERRHLFFDATEPGWRADSGDPTLGWPPLAGESRLAI